MIKYIIYSGDAIADGCELKTEYFSKHHGLSEEEKKEMTAKALEEHEAKMMEKNAWCIAEDIKERVNGEPGPEGGYMLSFVSDKQGTMLS